MIKQWIVTSLFLALFFCCSSSITNQADEALQVAQAFHAAFDAKNITAMTALCEEKMFWYTLDGRALARDELAGFFRPMFANWNKIQTTLSDFQICRSGRLCVIRYRSTIRIESQHHQSNLKGIHTMALIAGGKAWKIWQHQMSIQ